MKEQRLIVIGGGAAGFFCAVNAARLNPLLKVIIVEKSNKLLGKVRISGGGRCNVAHACFSIAEMIKQYPRGGRFLKRAFHHFFTSDTIAWFNERGVALKTEPDGRVFPVTDTSQTIIDCFMKEANKYGVEILMNREVVEMQFTGSAWVLISRDGKQLPCDYVCVASGGYPKPGQFDWIISDRHGIEGPVPSLFTFNIPGNAISDLMGITVSNTRVRISGTKLCEEGPLLITHWGMSGPVILRLSAWGARELALKKWQFEITVNWLPAFHEQSLREKMQRLRFESAPQKIINRNPFGLPKRFWEYLIKESGINEELRWADLPVKAQSMLIKNLCAQEFRVNGKTTFKEEFVTAGGINLEEIDLNTMQSKKMPGLFFAGEVINIDGVTGGYNFQSAWTSGWIAANGIAGLPGRTSNHLDGDVE